MRVDYCVSAKKSPPKVSGDEKDAEDAKLVAGLIRREPWAFTAAYEAYKGRIYTFLMRLCGRRELADDLFQDTFLQLARHAGQLRPDTELGAFLFTVARNRYRSHRRTSLFRRLRLQLMMLGGADRLAPASVPETPFEHAVQGDLSRRLEQAIHQLADAQREVLLLVGVEGMDQDRAARVLGLSSAALRQRLSRARAEVQAFLDKDGSGAPSKINAHKAMPPKNMQSPMHQIDSSAAARIDSGSLPKPERWPVGPDPEEPWRDEKNEPAR